MTNKAAGFETRCLSSLSKVFADVELHDLEVNSGTALWGEVYSFQVAYRSTELRRGLQVTIESTLTPYITVRSVGLSPSNLPTFKQIDDDYLRTTPGLYPDVLYPIEQEHGLLAQLDQWRSVWVTIKLPEKNVVNGSEKITNYPIKVLLHDHAGNGLDEVTFTLQVLPAELPAQTLQHTEWFHGDCIATQYDVAILSEEHWALIEAYVKNAVQHGVNMLLTPLFTLPLDTAVGGERPTMQLIEVELLGEHQYQFNFDLLERWIAMSERVGVTYIEFSHLFTQWGGAHAPKIVAKVNGKQEKIFGWETDASGEDYRTFLDQFLPELVSFIKQKQLEQRVYFHVSDEPGMQHLDSYKQAKDILKRHLAKYPFIDALSNYEFYQLGLVDLPVPANDHVEAFIENKVEPLWTYYCCSQNNLVSNRFFSMPSYRNRIIGFQLYKFDVQGFLHWGFNFWNSQYSTRPINPFQVTDADSGFPSGDPFVVYPGADGPIDSLRWEVFFEGLQDMRALQLLDQLVGKEQVMALIEQQFPEGITFNNYPKSIEWLLDTRKRINEAIVAAMEVN
ncbi:DUF4091 domain-containing protein [Paenibacillus yanchengensis]|uniref:DUF4091 domain-containing protein n=1 Tax=Paenibacillus yanchengensis TaxID=2035833 RepID=A0ABW4YHN7_9BACL